MPQKQPKQLSLRLVPLRERVQRFVEARTRDIAVYENASVQSKATAAKMDVLREALELVGSPLSYGNGKHDRDRIRFKAKYLADKGSIPESHEVGTYDDAMFAGIAYKQVALQLEALLEALPEDEEE